MLGERAEELIKEGVNYRNKRTSRTKYNQWKQEVYLLEEEFELTMAAHKRDYPIFVYWGMLVLGIIGYVALVIKPRPAQNITNIFLELDSH